MNERQRALRAIEFLTLFHKGNVIEYKSIGGQWCPCGLDTLGAALCCIAYDNYEFRVKPKEETRWLNIFPGSIQVAFKTKDEADDHDRQMNGYAQKRIACVQIKFIEGEGL